MKPALLLLLLIINLYHTRRTHQWKIQAKRERSVQRHKRAARIQHFRFTLRAMTSPLSIFDYTQEWFAKRKNNS